MRPLRSQGSSNIDQPRDLLLVPGGRGADTSASIGGGSHYRALRAAAATATAHRIPAGLRRRRHRAVGRRQLDEQQAEKDRSLTSPVAKWKRRTTAADAAMGWLAARVEARRLSNCRTEGRRRRAAVGAATRARQARPQAPGRSSDRLNGPTDCSGINYSVLRRGLAHGFRSGTWLAPATAIRR